MRTGCLLACCVVLSFALQCLLPLPTCLAIPQKVNINKAGVAEFSTLPGVGPKTAEKIVAYREAHGPFKQIEDLQDVPGIGPGKFEKLRNFITVGSATKSAAGVSKSKEKSSDSPEPLSFAQEPPDQKQGELLPADMIPRTCWSCKNKCYVHNSLTEGWCPYCGKKWKVKATSGK